MSFLSTLARLHYPFFFAHLSTLNNQTNPLSLITPPLKVTPTTFQPRIVFSIVKQEHISLLKTTANVDSIIKSAINYSWVPRLCWKVLHFAPRVAQAGTFCKKILREFLCEDLNFEIEREEFWNFLRWNFCFERKRVNKWGKFLVIFSFDLIFLIFWHLN